MNSRRGRVLLSWVLRVITWDGALPAFIWAFFHVLTALAPNWDDEIAVFGVLFLIVAFFLRMYAGACFIAANGRSAFVQNVQYLVFCFGLFVLTIIDGLMIAGLTSPKVAQAPGDDDTVIWTVLLSLYLVPMAIAMYPGRAESREPRAGNTPASSPWTTDAIH